MRLCPALLAVVIVASVNAEEPAKPLTPAEAAKKIDQKCLIEMEVKSAGMAKSGKAAFLNSETDFKSPTNFTVMLGQSALEKLKEKKIDDITAYYKGKTIRVSGTVKLYRDKPEIIVDDPKEITIVEKKK